MYATVDIHSAGANAPCVGDRRIGVADADIPDVDQLPTGAFCTASLSSGSKSFSPDAARVFERLPYGTMTV